MKKSIKGKNKENEHQDQKTQKKIEKNDG